MNKILLLILFPFFIQAQDIPLKANVILVHGVSFKEVVNKLLDSGYSIKKIDSNFNTIETEAREVPKQALVLQMILKARIKDSILTITGLYGFPDNTNNKYRAGSIGAALAGVNMSIANLKSWQRRKVTPFSKMKDFALSFNKPVEYLVQ